MTVWSSSAHMSVIGDKREELGLARRSLWLQLLSESAVPVPGLYLDAMAELAADSDACADVDDGLSDNDTDGGLGDYSDAETDAGIEAHAEIDAVSHVGESAEFKEGVGAVQTGLYVVTLTQGGGWTVLRVGWFRRDPQDPDEYEVRWCTIYRPDRRAQLAPIWLGGPKEAPREWEFSAPVPSVAHRLHFQPLAKLDPALWASVCGPRPEGWKS